MHHQHVEVILQVLADAGQGMHAPRCRAAQLVGGADARQHQQLRRIDGAGGEHDFALARATSMLAEPQVVHANGALALEDQPACAAPR